MGQALSRLLERAIEKREEWMLKTIALALLAALTLTQAPTATAKTSDPTRPNLMSR